MLCGLAGRLFGTSFASPTLGSSSLPGYRRPARPPVYPEPECPAGGRCLAPGAALARSTHPAVPSGRPAFFLLIDRDLRDRRGPSRNATRRLRFYRLPISVTQI